MRSTASDPIAGSPISSPTPTAGDPDRGDHRPAPAEVPHARRYNRRAALVNGVAGMAAIYSATRLDWNRVWEAAAAEAAENPAARKLVLIYLQGGADSLNMFVPTEAGQYSRYMAQRGNIARLQGASVNLQQVGATPFAGAAGSQIAFANPLLSGATNNQLYTMAGIPAGAGGLDTLFGDGTGGAGSNLAVFPAADYNPANHSHFDSRDYWFAGAVKKQTTGWIGRYLDREGSQLNPLQAVSLDSSLSKQIRTSRAPVCALDGLQGIQFDVRNVVTPANSAEPPDRQAGQGSARRSPNVALARSRQSFGLTTSVSNKVRTLHPAGSAAPYPNSFLSNRLRLRGAAARRAARHPRGDARLGQLRHARRRGQLDGSAARRARLGARRVPGRPERPRHRRPGDDAWCSRSSAAASTRTTPAAPTTAPAGR